MHFLWARLRAVPLRSEFMISWALVYSSAYLGGRIDEIELREFENECGRKCISYIGYMITIHAVWLSKLLLSYKNSIRYLGGNDRLCIHEWDVHSICRSTRDISGDGRVHFLVR